MKNLTKLLTPLLLLVVGMGQVWAGDITIKVHNVNGDGTVQSGTPKIYFWNVSGSTTTWNESPEMIKMTGINESDWYYYTLTDSDNSFNYIIRYSNSNQQSANLSATGDVCVNVVGTSVTCPTIAVVKYYIKHNWGGTGSWTWQEMSDDDEDGIWTYEGKYGATGCNWNTKNSDDGATWVASPTLVGSPANGDDCEFALNSSTKAITITKKPTCTTGAPSIAWATAPADGTAGGSMTASVTVAAGGSVAWTSSNTSAATVNASTGAISYVAAGNTTIRATVTNDTYCTTTAYIEKQITVSAASTYSLTVAKGANISSVTGGVTGKTSVPFDGGTISATPATGYDFATWTASPAANATFASATSASTTVTVKNGSVTVTASAKEHMNTITIVGGTTASTTAGVVTTGSITAAEKVGYVFKSWEATTGVTLTSATSKTTTVKASQNGTVTATYTPVHAYIQGRFRVRASEGGEWMYTGSSDGGWNTSSKTIELAFNETTKKYELNTYATVKELSTNYGSSGSYFRVATVEGDGNTFTHYGIYGSSGSNNFMFSSSNKEATLTKDATGNNCKFNDTDDKSGPVILTFDPSTKKLSYEAAAAAPEITFGVNNGSYGSVTATYNGTTITSGYKITETGHNAVFTATPADGYYLRGWYSDEACNTRLAYATNESNYVYTIKNVAADQNVYAKFEAIPSNIQFDGTVSGRSWSNCWSATSSTDNSYTWVFPNAATNDKKEFVIKTSSCSDLIKAASEYATYSATGCTVTKSNNNDNYCVTNAEPKIITITVTYGSGVHVAVSAADETKYTVTVNNGDHGTVTPNGDQNVGATGITLTPSAGTGYYQSGWETTGGAAVADNKLTATADGTATAQWSPVWSLRGGFNSWNSDANKFTTFDGNVSTTVVHLTKDQTYDFLIYAHGDSNSPYYNSGTMTRDNCTGWTMSKQQDGKNAKITADVTGDYTFSFDISTKKLSVTYPCKPTGWTIDFDNGKVTDIPLEVQADGSYKLTFYIDNDNRLFRVTDGCATYTINATQDAYSANLSGTLVESTYKMGYDGSLMNFVTATVKNGVFTMGAASAEDINLALTAEIENPTREAGSSTIHFQNIHANVPAGMSNVTMAIYPLTANNVNSKGTAFITNLPVTTTEWTSAAQTFEAGQTYYYCLSLYENGAARVNSQVLTITVNAQYAVTVVGGTPAEVSANETVKPTITADTKDHYYFDKWTATEGITITDASASETTVAATQAGTVTANFLPSWDLRGSFNSWSGTANPFTEFDASNNTSVTVNLTAGSYTFKVHHQSATSWYSTSTAFTRANAATGATLSGSVNDNISLTADIDGNYVFHFNTDTKKLTITYPTPDTYTIHYVTNGGEAIADGSYTETAAFDLPTSTRTGYAFRGWYDNEELTGDKVTTIPVGSTGDKTFYAKWKQEGWYLHYQTADDKWHERLFSGSPLTVTQEFTDASHNYKMEILKVADGQSDAYYKNVNYMTSSNCTDWTYTTSADLHGFTSTIAGNYVFTMTVNGEGNPVLSLTYPQWSCAFGIPGLVNTLQESTVTFTPNVVNYTVTGYELYYTNDGGANWTLCEGVAENAGVYSYAHTFAEAGTYQLKVVVKNGDDQVGEAFLSETFPVVEPTISIAVSDYPRAGQTVTVTPTVTNLQSGTYYYCWSIVDQTVDFTDNENGTWSFTAPAAGDYTLRLEVKPGSNCSGTTIISKDQALTILGNEVVVKAGVDGSFWTGAKVYYSSAAHDMTDLGTDRNSVHWYSATIPAASIGTSMVFFNAVDDSPQGTTTQTANITIPQENTCYKLLNHTSGTFNNRDYETADCPGGPEVVITSATGIVLNGTYHITANYYMIPGEVSYTYSVKNPSGGNVTVTDAAFTAVAEGDYTVTVNAVVAGETKATATITVACVNAAVVAYIDESEQYSTSVDLNTKVELIADVTGFTHPTYQWYVQLPATSNWVTLSGYTGQTANYTVTQAGTYTFRVIATEDGASLTSNNITATVTIPEVWIKYSHKENCTTGTSDDTWCWEQMTYNTQDGYYWHEGYYRATGVNINDKANDTGKAWHQDGTDFYTNEGVSAGQTIYYVYDKVADHMYLRPLGNYYRIRSNAENGVFYSNVVNLSDGTTADVSFFATTGATSSLKLEKLVGTTWEEQSTLSASITEDNVYTAKLSTTALSNVALYTGDFKVFTDVFGGSKTMQKFNNVDPAEFYNHYACKWIDGSSKNAGATVGNDINHNLSITLPSDIRDHISVRYAYKPETNHFSRAYLHGSLGTDGGKPDEFLVVYGTNVTKVDGTNIYEVSSNQSTCQAFTENSDWVYSTYIKATCPATIKLAAKVGSEWQYLLDAGGSEATSRNIYGSINDQTPVTLRFLISYDFKTNRVIAAWAPDGTETFDHAVTMDADLVVVRQAHNYNKPVLFTLLGDGQVKLIRKIITMVEVHRDSLFTNSSSTLRHEGTLDKLFQISLPYDVEVAQITGMDNYGSKVVLQSYLGELRAALGWQSYISTFWSNIPFNSTSKLIANRGYVISNNWQYGDFTDVQLEDKSYLAIKRIYFPSAISDEGYIIGPISKYAPTTFAALNCAISGREKIDSNWRMIGLPGFFAATVKAADPEGTHTGTMPRDDEEDPNKVVDRYTLHWIYDWNGSYNSYTAYKASDFRFEPTKAYLVQYAGTVSWTDPVEKNINGENDMSTFPVVDPEPAAVAARQMTASTAKNGEYRVELYNAAAQFEDQTFVVLDAQATEDYEMNLDLQKAFTAEAPQLFSVTPTQLLAANTLSSETTTVPLGTSLPAMGTYTIHLGKMSAGAQIPYLYDAENNSYTNLTTDNYTFAGVAGKQTNRFSLLFGYRPPTIVTDCASAAADELNVAVVNGKIIITGATTDEVRLYDASGRLVSSASLRNGNAITAPSATGVYLLRAGNQTKRVILN